MFRTLYARLSFALVALLLSVGVLYTLLSLSSAQYYLQETDQKLHLDLAKNLVADRNLVQSGRINEKALKATFMKYMVINPSIEIYLLDLKGNILSYSADPGKVKRNSVSLKPIKAFLRGDKLPLLGDDPRNHDRQKIFSVTPVPSAENPEGYLYVVLLGQQYDNAEQFIKESIIWKQTGWSLLGSLLLGLIAGLWLFRRLTQRLNRLSTEMDGFRQSDFHHLDAMTFTSKSRDEIDRLGHTFHQMAERIVSQLDELKQQDSLRRELVANVSHDLRTPVAILHGYLETLELKGDRLDEQQRDHYLKQALQSSDRLNQLISELFELARLEAQESVPEQEPFNLAELAQDVVQKFQLRAAEKNIALTLDVTCENLFACGDIGLIARVFENLLGNAIKFTPADGEVSVTLTNVDDSCAVRIQDSGPGIKSAELDKIFDRFYQGSDNGNRAKPGGLGLAIAKRIVDLHGGWIGVASEPGRGTCFNFSLPQKSL
jgi:two-component system OmpR family sensor kinase